MAHFSAGYNNSQSVVRFLDTKAAAVLGAVPVLLGILAAIFTWLEDFSEWHRVITLDGLWLGIACGGSLLVIVATLFIFAWLTVKAAFNAILPRDTSEALPSLIFPFEAPGFESRVSVFTDEPAQSDAIEDYRRQVLRMSQIVPKKFFWVNCAIRRLKGMFFFTGLTLVVMLLTAITSTAIAQYKSAEPGAPTRSSASASASKPEAKSKSADQASAPQGPTARQHRPADADGMQSTLSPPAEPEDCTGNPIDG